MQNYGEMRLCRNDISRCRSTSLYEFKESIPASKSRVKNFLHSNIGTCQKIMGRFSPSGIFRTTGMTAGTKGQKTVLTPRFLYFLNILAPEFSLKFQHTLYLKCEYYRNQKRQHYEIDGILKREKRRMCSMFKVFSKYIC